MQLLLFSFFVSIVVFLVSIFNICKYLFVIFVIKVDNICWWYYLFSAVATKTSFSIKLPFQLEALSRAFSNDICEIIIIYFLKLFLDVFLLSFKFHVSQKTQINYPQIYFLRLPLNLRHSFVLKPLLFQNNFSLSMRCW